MTKILIPAQDRTVFLPDGTLWPSEGLEDPGTLFTRRRLADGDLIEKPSSIKRPDDAKKPEGDK